MKYSMVDLPLTLLSKNPIKNSGRISAGIFSLIKRFKMRFDFREPLRSAELDAECFLNDPKLLKRFKMRLDFRQTDKVVYRYYAVRLTEKKNRTAFAVRFFGLTHFQAFLRSAELDAELFAAVASAYMSTVGAAADDRKMQKI